MHGLARLDKEIRIRREEGDDLRASAPVLPQRHDGRSKLRRAVLTEECRWLIKPLVVRSAGSSKLGEVAEGGRSSGFRVFDQQDCCRNLSQGDVMNDAEQSYRARAGDVVAVTGHRVGETGRTGEILEVIGEPTHEHYRVRWEDGHESIFYPSSDAIIRPGRTSREEKA
jgi:uncharacterized protein DUF1918